MPWIHHHWDSIVAVAALVVAVFAALYARASARQAERTNEFPALLDLAREYRGIEDERNWVINHLREMENPEAGIRGLSPDSRAKVLAISHYLDQLGVLVHRGLADEKAITAYLGGSILRLWGVIGPFVIAERTIRGEPYQRFFEDLAARVADRGFEAAQSGLIEISPAHPSVLEALRSIGALDKSERSGTEAEVID